MLALREVVSLELALNSCVTGLSTDASFGKGGAGGASGVRLGVERERVDDLQVFEAVTETV